MRTEERINYWRGRLRLAGKLGLKREGDACLKILDLLLDSHKKEQAVERAISRTVNGMPQEKYEAN